jgi:hypothetical protein
MVMAVERVRQRLLRAVSALESAGAAYAVAGGHAVAAWVATVDPSAVRNTPDVNILIRRADFAVARGLLEAAGFVYRPVSGVHVFLDGPDARARDAVHVFFAGEKVREEHVCAAPDVDESTTPGRFRVVTLESLVRMKLTSFRLKDRVHIQDMIEVGLIGRDWAGRLPPELAPRLREITDAPDA